MSSPENPRSLIRFGPYAADLNTGELWKDGARIRLQLQPFEVLRIFLERPNELITREELQKKIWPSDTFVDFDQGLNKAINKLRDALHDTADHPQFIETIPRRGYRFIAPVIPPEVLSEETPTIPSAAPASPRVIPSKGVWALAVMGIILLLALSISFLQRRNLDGASSNSVAVLPLLAPETSAGDYDVADGMTDGIINDLSLVPELRVTSHASVFQYRGQTPDPRAIGQKLNVTAVLTGRLWQSGSNIVVRLELTATSDGRRLWGQEYSRNAADRAELQQEIAGAIADALRLDRREVLKTAKIDAEAQQLYLKGRYYFFKETPEDVRLARSLFQKAIDRDPGFALAYSALGDSYDWMATEGYQPLGEVLGQAQLAKAKASGLNDSSAEVRASAGALEFIQWNWAKAELEFQQALRLNPNYFEGHHLYSIYLRSMRRFPEAIEHSALADRLNPLSMPARSNLALTYYYARQYEVAAAQYRQIIKDDAEAPGAHAGLAAVLLKMGREKEAVPEWEKALSLAGDEAAALQLRRTYSRAGLQAATNFILKQELGTLERTARTEYVSPIEFAFRYALLNDKDNAFRWLERAYAERSPQLFNLNVDPDYDNLRSDPRFTGLAARLHLPQ